jgi:glycosyltransferase involved in cell wall biosynthesis
MRRGLELTRREASVVVCSSEDTRRACLAAGIDDDRLRVVPLGTDTEPASLGAIADAKARFGLRRPYIAWVGTFEPRKNVSGLLTAFAIVAQRNPELELVLVGPSGWGPQLTALAERMDAGARARVRALGFLPDAQRNAVVAGASAFCYPSTREGFGLPVLEAMVQGTPVVTSQGTATE